MPAPPDDESAPTDPPAGPPGNGAPEEERHSRRPMGIFVFLAVVIVVVGVLVFRGDGEADPPADAASTLPTLAVPDVGTPGDGEAAPNITITLIDGTLFDLDAHLSDDGRPVFLNFWASWCVPCRNEMPAIQQASLDHPDVLFLGIAVDDDPQAAEGFAREVAVTYPIGIDESETVGAAYPTFGLPATFLITADGMIATQVFGEVTQSEIDELLGQHF